MDPTAVSVGLWQATAAGFLSPVLCQPGWASAVWTWAGCVSSTIAAIYVSPSQLTHRWHLDVPVSVQQMNTSITAPLTSAAAVA